MSFSEPEKVSNPLITFRGLDVGYGETRILRQISQTILPGARIGVLGVNGAGKSTLLKALIGELEPLSGNIERGAHAKVGYFAQHQLETLDIKDSALNTIQNHYPDMTGQEARDYLGGWGFDAGMISRPINSLSGGEKARFVLALLASERPAMLVLDEPTNHLDLDMRDALALALQSFTGAVLIVAHDRDLLEKLVDEFWVVDEGRLMSYEDDIRDYTGLRLAGAKINSEVVSDADSSRKEQRQERARHRQSLSDLKSELKQTERAMSKESEELAGIERKLADEETYQGLSADEIQDLLTRAARQRKRTEELENKWLKLSEELEALKESSDRVGPVS